VSSLLGDFITESLKLSEQSFYYRNDGDFPGVADLKIKEKNQFF